ncbi:MAG: hypothetical protein M3N97_13690 [Pseudomonadota bacterium]|nr:hypothetical protein [Pseudomonadota bacterium]
MTRRGPYHHPPARLSSRHQRWLYGVSGALLLSGLGWLVSHYMLAGNDLSVAFEFGGLPHPAEPWWLRLHGAAMLGFLVVFGSLLPGHVVHGWRHRRNHRSGLFMLVTVSALTLTGYLLYYWAEESTRPWISAAHWVLGLGATLGLVLHVIGKRSARPIRADSRALRRGLSR